MLGDGFGVEDDIVSLELGDDMGVGAPPGAIDEGGMRDTVRNRSTPDATP